VRADVAAVLQRLGEVETVLPRGVLVPSMTGEAVGAPGEPAEPIYERAVRDDVQGNIIPGFNKDHQHFLFLRIVDVKRARRRLRAFAPQLATMDDVLAFVRAHRSQRLRTGVREPRLSATWVNVAFSYSGIAALAGRAEAERFGDQSFRQGLAARSTYLGDPASPEHEGHRSRWKVRDADALVIVAADEARDLEDEVAELLASLDGFRVLFAQRGDTLPGPLRGREHFGFKDGISQPGVRGRVSSAPGDFITPRYLAAGDPHARLFAKPGQPLIWPGQFLLGEPRQHTQDLFAPAPAAANFPAWARRGSYLVCRRLRQDGEAFWGFVIDAAKGGDPVRFASRLVGRWPSGAPVMRSPDADNPALGGDEFANNHFLYEDDTRPSVLQPIPGYGGDHYAAARADVLGGACPHFAHIRKVNPRDAGTDMGTPADSLLRLMLRRGIPFGPPAVGVEQPSNEERGLLFVAFAATIEDQFEFITRRWANSALHPRFGGRDPIIGLDREFVTPTGGGYFFAPPISAIADVLGA
jgi:Dyp-type peroxidase family